MVLESEGPFSQRDIYDRELITPEVIHTAREPSRQELFNLEPQDSYLVQMDCIHTRKQMRNVTLLPLISEQAYIIVAYFRNRSGKPYSTQALQIKSVTYIAKRKDNIIMSEVLKDDAEKTIFAPFTGLLDVLET